jgi:hypothetical protein
MLLTSLPTTVIMMSSFVSFSMVVVCLVSFFRRPFHTRYTSAIDVIAFNSYPMVNSRKGGTDKTYIVNCQRGRER